MVMLRGERATVERRYVGADAEYLWLLGRATGSGGGVARATGAAGGSHGAPSRWWAATGTRRHIGMIESGR